MQSRNLNECYDHLRTLRYAFGHSQARIGFHSLIFLGSAPDSFPSRGSLLANSINNLFIHAFTLADRHPGIDTIDIPIVKYGIASFYCSLSRQHQRIRACPEPSRRIAKRNDGGRLAEAEEKERNRNPEEKKGRKR